MWYFTTWCTVYPTYATFLVSIQWNIPRFDYILISQNTSANWDIPWYITSCKTILYHALEYTAVNNQCITRWKGSLGHTTYIFLWYARFRALEEIFQKSLLQVSLGKGKQNHDIVQISDQDYIDFLPFYCSVDSVVLVSIKMYHTLETVFYHFARGSSSKIL